MALNHRPTPHLWVPQADTKQATKVAYVNHMVHNTNSTSVAMVSNLEAMASNLAAMASTLVGKACNLVAMLVGMASNLEAMASTLVGWPPN